MSNPTDRRLAPQAPDFADMLAKGRAEIEGYHARIAELESICGNLRRRAEAEEECIVHQAKGSADDEHRIDYFTEGRDAARAEVVELRELLRKVSVTQGGGSMYDWLCCSCCGGDHPEFDSYYQAKLSSDDPTEEAILFWGLAHSPDCELAAALAHDHTQTTTEPEQPPPIQAD